VKADIHKHWPVSINPDDYATQLTDWTFLNTWYKLYNHEERQLANLQQARNATSPNIQSAKHWGLKFWNQTSPDSSEPSVLQSDSGNQSD
jgi:hypothetical protein